MLDPKTGPTTTQYITLTPTMKRIESHMQVYGIGSARTNPPKNRQNSLRPEAEKSAKNESFWQSPIAEKAKVIFYPLIYAGDLAMNNR
jgi:hypothetical protein